MNKTYIELGDQLRITYHPAWRGEAIIRYVERAGQGAPERLITWTVSAQCLSTGRIGDSDFAARDRDDPMRVVAIPMRTVARCVAIAVALRIQGELAGVCEAIIPRDV